MKITDPRVIDLLTAYNHFALIAALAESLLGAHTMVPTGSFEPYENGISSPAPCGEFIG